MVTLVKTSKIAAIGAQVIKLVDGEFLSLGIVNAIFLNGVSTDNGGFYYFCNVDHYRL